MHTMIALALAFASCNIHAQATTSDPIPPEVLAILKTGGPTTELLVVNPGDVFPGRVVRADQIVFSPGGTLALTDSTAETLVVVTKKLKFADPSIPSRIFTRLAAAPSGTYAPPGRTEPAATGATNKRGNFGKPGGPGLEGGTGQSSPAPKIWLIVGEIVNRDGQLLTRAKLNLSIEANGVKGGIGGKGGPGGDGGDGAPGQGGESNSIRCNTYGGIGGNGGMAGQGGKGGRGGNGSDGSDIHFAGSLNTLEVLSFVSIRNDPGPGGDAGPPGDYGHGGKGGLGASRSGWCPATKRGEAAHRPPKPPNLGTLGPGNPGQNKGRIYLHEVPDVSRLM
jgi:hypothetical protein